MAIIKLEKQVRNGFTLIELIVVVTIISVLTVIGALSFSNVNVNSRDSRRKSDLEKIRIALEMYKQDLGSTYPATTSISTTLSSKGYLSAWPIDPKGYTYEYAQTGSGYTYTLRAYMEGVGSTNISKTGNCAGTLGCNYQVTQP